MVVTCCSCCSSWLVAMAQQPQSRPNCLSVEVVYESTLAAPHARSFCSSHTVYRYCVSRYLFEYLDLQSGLGYLSAETERGTSLKGHSFFFVTTNIVACCCSRSSFLVHIDHTVLLPTSHHETFDQLHQPGFSRTC
jgi:hypothetical protein